MRDFAKVSPLFWTRGSGKRLRGNADAQVLALYLLTCPSANMVGVYYVPFVTMAHESGLGEERARDAVTFIARSGFAFYDHDHELAWVPNMAAYQIGDELKPGDKRRGGVLAELYKMGGHEFVKEFWKTYGLSFGLGECPFQGPSKPLARGMSEIGEEKEKEKENEKGAFAPDGRTRVKPTKGTRIADDWQPSAALLAWCAQEGIRNPLGPLDEFKDFWRGIAGQKGVKLDWDATYRNRLRELVERGRLEQRKQPKVTAQEQAEPRQRAEDRAGIFAAFEAFCVAEQEPLAGMK